MALIVFLALAVPYLNSPGVYYDEALQASVGISLSQHTFNPYPSAWTVMIGGHALTVMTLDYIGSIKGYLLGVAFYVFGCSAPVLRLTTIMIGFVGLVFTGCFARKAFGRIAAVSSVFLIATDPSFIVLAKLDWGPQMIAFTLRMGSLYCLACWWKSGGHTKYLACGAALLGLGVYDKASFLWFVVALSVAGLFLWVTSRRRPRVGARSAAFAGGAFFLASAPLWLYNISHRWTTFRQISMPGEAASIERIVRELPPRTHALLALLAGRAVDDWIFGQAVAPTWGISETVLLPLSILALVVIVVVCVGTKSPTLLALPLLLGVFAAEIYSTPRAVWVHHWIGLYPLPHLMIGLAGALALSRPIDKVVPRRVSACLVTALLGLAVTCNVAVMRGYHRLMAEQRTSLAWSDAIFALAASLKADDADRMLQLMDWGTYSPLNLLSAGRLHLREPFWSETGGSAPSPGYLQMLAQPSSLFVFVDSQPPRSRRLFEMAVRHAGMAVTSDRTFSDRYYGRPVYSVVGLSPQAAPKSPAEAR